MNTRLVELPGLGAVWRVEAPPRRKKRPANQSVARRWPRLRMVDGQFVICVEK
jgi:hypothetical protein